jgi:hypothetical protein
MLFPTWFLETELKAFFEIVPDLLEGPESVFSFWNGLGATSESSLEVLSSLQTGRLNVVSSYCCAYPQTR